MSFGRFVKKLRIAREMTLRQFCKEYGHDPSNWSKIERDINPPPRDDTVIGEWARQLGLNEGMEEWQRFMDEAAISRKQIPPDFLEDETILQKLPVFFRAIRGTKMDDASIDKFIEKVRDAYRPNNQGQVPPG